MVNVQICFDKTNVKTKKISRVPCLGEFVYFSGGLYEVTSVEHYLNNSEDDSAAYICVENV